MRSMTGFGQSAGTSSSHRVAVTLRSVNSRYLDLVIRLREEQKGLEARIRSVLEAELHRGRVEATIEIRSLRPLPAEVDVQTEVVLALHRASHELAEKGLVARELSVGDLLSLPGVVELRLIEDCLSGAGLDLLEAQVTHALGELVTSRRAEGERLFTVLTDRIAELDRVVEALEAQVVVASRNAEERLRQRVDQLLGDREVDPERLAQEIAFLADKTDVREELDRLAGHLEAFRGALGTAGPSGRRLDFVVQEMLRELNTLGSKARDGAVTESVLEAKLICEQLREQVQNVE